MRHALTIHPRDVRRHLSAATAVALVAAIPVAAVDAVNVATAVRQNRQYAVEATQSDVMSAYAIHRQAWPSFPDPKRNFCIARITARSQRHCVNAVESVRHIHS